MQRRTSASISGFVARSKIVTSTLPMAPGSRQALAAARAMVEGVAALSAELAGDLPAPLRIGIGTHAGLAVVGRMGWGDSFYLTAVGDTVHVAARLEQSTKD